MCGPSGSVSVGRELQKAIVAKSRGQGCHMQLPGLNFQWQRHRRQSFPVSREAPQASFKHPLGPIWSAGLEFDTPAIIDTNLPSFHQDQVRILCVFLSLWFDPTDP